MYTCTCAYNTHFSSIPFFNFCIFCKFKGHNEPDEVGPHFLAQLTNITVPQGRDISFTCVVDNLGQYRVCSL